ncbi:MAG TPA: sigma-70 family RNA polymerase sigma factor [Gemmataceae bacterium]|jgi:RNA polymerase sigma-70 factor (ECF subfamily)|nr:sigma-70 family RNA polymerase sigma factor [Gemmataceae bacterium]
MIEEAPRTTECLNRIRAGDTAALAELFEAHRPQLRRMVDLRLDRHVAARLDPSDVLQEVYLDMAGQMDAYLRKPRVAFYVWLRGLTWERLLKLHRRYLGAGCRTVIREQALPLESSAALAGQLLARGPSPSEALVKQELRRRVQQALAKLAEEDREVILMRDFEDMTNGEVAQALALGASGATMRYGRAIFRLKEILSADWPAGESKP